MIDGLNNAAFSRYITKVIKSFKAISCQVIGRIWEKCAFTLTTIKQQFFLANFFPPTTTKLLLSVMTTTTMTSPNFVFTMFRVVSLALRTPQQSSACLPPKKVKDIGTDRIHESDYKNKIRIEIIWDSLILQFLVWCQMIHRMIRKCNF